MSYQLKCKACGKTLLKYEAYEKKYKSPLSRCSKCGQEYIDPRCQEMAVTGIPESEFKTTRCLIMLVVGALILWRAIHLYGVKMLGMPDSMQMFLPTIFLLLGAGCILAAVVDFIRIKSGLKAKKYQKLFDESRMRMQDEGYVEKLRRYGYIK